MRTSIHSLSSSILAAALTLPAAAQAPQQIDPITLAGEGIAARTAAGDLDADGVPEVICLRSSEVVVTVSAASNPWSMATAWTASDLAVLPDPEGDVLVLVGPSGAHRGTLSGAGVFATQPMATGDWVGAKLVDTGHTLVSGNNLPVVVGVMANRRTVRKLLPAGGGGWTSSLVPLPVLAEDVLELALCDLDANQELEVALLTASGVLIYRLDGTLMASYATTTYAPTGLAVGEMASGSDWVAVTTVKNGVDYVLTCSGGGWSSMNPLGALGVVSVATARWSGDDNDDLVLGLNGSAEEVGVLANDGTTGPDFSGDYTAIELGSTQANASHVAVIDLDADLDEDLALAVAGTGTSALCRNPRNNHVLLLPELLEIEDFADVLAAPQVGCGTSNVEFRLLIQVGRPTNGAASVATHVAYAVWKQEDPTGGGALANSPSEWPTDATAVKFQMVEQLQGDSVVLDIKMPDPGTGNTGCEALGVYSNHIYYVELELQERNAAGTVVLTTFPAKLLGVQTQGDENTTNGGYLSTSKISGTSTSKVFLAGSNTDPTNVGSVNEMPELPNLSNPPIVK